ncbi:MAG TPA: hypothetical protein V6C52_00880 [Coleofasciculaceae cyanobacterium]
MISVQSMPAIGYLKEAPARRGAAGSVRQGLYSASSTDHFTHIATKAPASRVVFGQIQPEQTKYLNQIILPDDTDENGLAKMGTILGVLDTAGVFAIRDHCSLSLRDETMPAIEHSHHKIPHIVTAGVNRVVFTNPPAQKFDLLMTEATLKHQGERSFEVEVAINYIDPLKTETGKRPIAKGFLTYAIVDKDHPPIPPLDLSQPQARKNHEAGEIRNQIRKQENRKFQALAEPDAFRVNIRETAPSTVVSLKTSAREANRFNNVFGGTTLELLYKAGEKAATRYAKVPVYGVRLDRMTFIKPGTVGKVLKACPVMVRTWNQRQMELQVDLIEMTPLQALWSTINRFLPWLRLPLPQGPTIATGFLVFEPQDPKLKVPEFIPRTPKETLRWKAAELRDEAQKAEELAIAAIQ